MTTTTYLWDTESDNLLSEDDGTSVMTYTNEPTHFGDLVSQKSSLTDNTNFYHFDARGDTRELTNALAVVTDTKLYDAWGNVLSSTGSTAMPFQFVGRVGLVFDKYLGLTMLDANFYDGAIARWLRHLLHPETNALLGLYAPKHSAIATAIRGQQAYLPASPAANQPSINVELKKRPRPRLSPTCPRIRAKVEWKFTISKWPCRGDIGYFVQKVDVDCDVGDCRARDPRETQVFSYYEAWRVRRPRNNGQVTAEDKAAGQFDGFGHYDQNGEVRFYCLSPNQKTLAGEILRSESSNPGPGSFGTGKCETSTISLHAVQDTPDFWERDPVASAERSIAIEWDCCCEFPAAAAYASPSEPFVRKKKQ